MLRGRAPTPFPFAIAALALTGCGDSPTTPPDPLAENPVAPHGDLALRFPAGPLAVPVHTQSTGARPPSGPAAVATDTDLTDVPEAQIQSALTQTGFRDGFAFAYGSHYYSANAGHVLVQADATHEGKHLGSQTAQGQGNVWFLLNFPQWKQVSAWAQIFTEHTCGVTVYGSSTHSTWWEFYQGVAVQVWGKIVRSTQGSPSSQPACGGGTGGYGQVEHEPGGLVCSYWITYDLATGEILSADFLGCSRSDDPKI